LYVPIVDVGWSQDVGRQLCEGKGVAIGRAVRSDAAWLEVCIRLVVFIT
jgi:hypothetical protein